MKKISCLFFTMLAMVVLVSSCKDVETYAEKKEKEKAAINAYIANHKVKVISESEFKENGYKTDTLKNEFVLFDSNGIYLQIVRKGCGKPLANGETSEILCRFEEYNLLTDSLQLTNNVQYFASIPERFTVTNTSGTFTGSFDQNSSMMYSSYTNSAVPSGWLFPLTYLNLGRPVKDDDEVAQIRVIVPSAQGQYYASMNVYPCLYELTYLKGR